MGVIESFFERRFHPSNPADWFLRLAGGPTASGVEVTHQNSLQVSAVYACVRVLSETVAMLPLILYRRQERGKERAVDRPLYSLLHDLPNPEMTSFELRETLMGHLGLWGNAYAEIEFNNAGRVRGIWPLRPDKVKVARIAGRLRYVIKMPTGRDIELPASRVMHIHGLSYDGIMGYDPITLHRQTVGLAKATEEFGARFFANGATLGVVYKHPGQLSDKAYNRLVGSLERRHGGLENSHRIALLEEGMDATSVGIPPENAQFLETRKFSVVEIARLYRMQPHKIQSMEAATFSNIEEQSIEFVTDTIQPWLTRFEQAIQRDLLTEPERRQYFAEHLVDALLRGNIQDRYEAYATARQNGWMSANDIRERENMNPVEGGDVYLVPLNMVPADMVGELGTGDGEEGGQRSERRDLPGWETRAKQAATQRQRLAGAMQRVILDTTARVIRREVNDVRRAVRKFFGQRDAQQFSLWMSEFYEEHREFWQRQMMPILLSYADQVGIAVADELGGEPRTAEEIRAFIDAYAEALGKRQVGKSIGTLQTILDRALEEGEDPAEGIEAKLDAWEESRAGQVAHKETFTANNAMAVAFYVASGVVKKRWVSIGDSCPYCRSLNGRVVGIQKIFLQAGVDFEPEGADKPLSPRSNVGHAPAHDGCDCMVVAA